LLGRIAIPSPPAQLAVLCETPPCAMSSMPTLEPPRNDDDVGVRLKGCKNACGIVTDQTREIHKTTVPLDERREHWTVGIRNLKIARGRSRGKQFVSGYRQAHSRLADHIHFSASDRTENTQILRTQHAPGLE
jgi:hypothetical protein